MMPVEVWKVCVCIGLAFACFWEPFHHPCVQIQTGFLEDKRLCGEKSQPSQEVPDSKRASLRPYKHHDSSSDQKNYWVTYNLF